MLAPVIFVLSLVQRRNGASEDGKLPPLVPLFVVGFLVMALLRTFVAVPDSVLHTGQFLQTTLLSAAMFALGCGVHVSLLNRVGGKSLILGVLSTVLIFVLAFVGMSILG